MFKDSGTKKQAVPGEDSKDDHQGTEELVQSELLKHQRLEQKFINEDSLDEETENNAQGQGGEGERRIFQDEERDLSFSHTPLTAPQAQSPDQNLDQHLAVKSS